MRWSIVLAVGMTLAGASVPLIIASSKPDLNQNKSLGDSGNRESKSKSFDPLTYTSIDQRIAQLEAQAQSAGLRRDVRSQLVIADIQLNNGQPKNAIATLDGLENSYPLLADYVLLKRAQAQTQLRDLQGAKATWENLVAKFPNSPAAAEAMFVLGQSQQLLEKFPAHPRSQELLLRQLSQSPNRVDLIAHLATYFADYKGIVPILNRLNNLSPNLTADQWWAIADAYYYNFEFGKAAIAYSRATVNPQTAYNYARSLHRGKQNDAALAAYNRAVQKFPQSPQAPRALIRITQIGSPQVAIAAADQIIANYGNTASEAIAIKVAILQDKLQSPQAASNARNLLLESYGSSNEAGALRWQIAKGQARSGQIANAIATIDRLIADSPNSSAAAEASFWAGKWANQIGDQTKAKRFFEWTIRQHPDSYYAWRSASSLGWQVGTFTTARYTNPVIALPSERQSLPAGSEKLQELYILGLDRDARTQWLTEIGGKRTLEPNEIFTDGVLRVANQDNLMGIRTLESLDWIDVSDQKKSEIAQLKKHPAYLRSLYPFHYWELISNWSRQRQLSPALVIGLMRQESRFEAQIQSSAGAVGLMQIMPDTGSWIASKKGVKSYSLNKPEDNISFGTWYLDYTHSTYGNDSMLAVASYNAGPGAVGRWVQGRKISDPDEFVNNIPYEETRDYVSKVLGNYWNYLRLYSPAIQQQIESLQKSSNSNAATKF
ncbi:lytic transglycosylase domain-containing protein [Pseudanabaena mucicola]|uniref:Transglycosylase SLT domain-containing protein n=1 Tax=Pseudanabaena mucicola FACHB-723 TaxID=2692860 RepID=A0ABR7ZVW1_9CYAN|nr:transglycosylase SLT domain-containing protein [Pseudanabaena mucicola]MBD2187659.1 transglycosylase SLT domain-containing protein [Pseudanabaena mucicola FACHB-723]